MSTRREFVGSVLAGAAALAVTETFCLPVVSLGANDRIRVGLIGAGGRGQEIFKTGPEVPQHRRRPPWRTSTRAAWTKSKQFAPQIKTYQDFRKLLDDKSIDAVLIATPQHQHVLNFVPAHPGGQGHLSGKDDGLQPGPRQADAQGLPGLGPGGPDRHSIDQRPRRRHRPRST